MDKEQIIVNGVNVRNCDFFLPNNKYCGMRSTGCRFVPNCHFKQLTRKTQIVEQQQKTINELIGCVSLWEGFTEEESKLAKDSSIADLIMILRKKTQECKELKVQLKNSENARNYAEKVCIDIELKKKIYKQALDEIESELKEDIHCESQECGCDDFEECLNCTKEHILDIIRKAKGEE